MDMKKILKDTAVLLVITLVSGLLLGLAYEVTDPIITARKEEEKAASYRGVFSEAASFESREELLAVRHAAEDADMPWTAPERSSAMR